MITSPSEPMSYKYLKDALNELTPEQLEMNVTVLLLGRNRLAKGYETYLFSELPVKIHTKLYSKVSQDVPIITVEEVG